MKKSKLSIIELNKSFGKKQVINGISYEFESGCYGILGPNGAGKTTFIRCILDFYRSNSGEIQFDGFSRDEIGYLPQKTSVFPGLTVYEQLEYYACLKDIDKMEWDSEIQRVLKLVNLEQEAGKKGRKLSGGMIRRVGIAQALLNHPKLLIFDEPTTGLDPEERCRFKDLLKQMKEDTIILMSTHIIDDVEDICNQIIVMNNGEFVFSGAKESLAAKAVGSDSVEDGYLCMLKNIS